VERGAPAGAAASRPGYNRAPFRDRIRGHPVRPRRWIITPPFTYEQLEHEAVAATYRHAGRVEVLLSRKRALVLNAFLRNDRRLRGCSGSNPSGWLVMASFSTAAFLTARMYLFHRKLYEVLALVALHDPAVDMHETGQDAYLFTFSQPEQESDGRIASRA
jgi:hypothetical protein